MRHRPILSVEKAELYTITDQKVMDLLPWTRIEKQKGDLIFFPKAGASGQILANPMTFALGLNWYQSDYRQAFKIDYTAGYKDANLVPEDLRDIIGKAAACKLLNIIGDGLIAGFSSSSLSMDGMSESFSSTQSATNAYFGARIGVYLKDIETYLKANKRKFNRFVVGSI